MLKELLTQTHRDSPIEGAKLFTRMMEIISNDPFMCPDCKRELKNKLYNYYFDVVCNMKSILDEMEDDCK